MTSTGGSIGWASFTVVALVFGTGCSGASCEELSKVRAELEAVRAELSTVKADHQAFKVDLEKLKTAGNARAEARDGRGKVSLPARFRSAMALSSVDQQQEAFAALAFEAARLGDGEAAKKCIGKLANLTQQQEVIYKSALRLAQAGEAESALALAKTLVNLNQQQKALSKLAKGDYQE